MGDKNFKNRQEHVDRKLIEEERELEEKIRMLRKAMGKKNQRRKYTKESSAPKRRRMGDQEYMEMRKTSGDGDGANVYEKRKGDQLPPGDKTVV